MRRRREAGTRRGGWRLRGPACAGGVVLLALVACTPLTPGSREARALGPRMAYPESAYPITSAFMDTHDSRGMRRRTAHAGIDIRAPRGTPVVAAAAGRVRVVQDPGAGTVILLEASDAGDAMLLEFAHLDTVEVRNGDSVHRGQVIATVGRSGRDSAGVAHLHFGVAPVGGPVTDPVPLLAGSEGIRCAHEDRGRKSDPVLLYPLACIRGE